MLSVAMCTYNGARFLPGQLASIREQTRQIDELIVCDDRSSDRTLDILREFASSAPFKVEIHRNEKNLGSTRNFEKCLHLCNGEILFLCDQDDVWHPDKVSRQVAYLEQHPSMDAIFSDAAVIDEHGTATGSRIWDQISFSSREQQRWHNGQAGEILFDAFVVTGATLALRRSALKQVTPFPVHLDKYIHDAWIALVLGIQNKIGFIPDTLLSYRVHSSQQVGLGEDLPATTLRHRLQRPREAKLAPLRKKATLLDELHASLAGIPSIAPQQLAPLSKRRRHFETRASLPANRLRRIVPVLSELLAGHYRYSSKSWWLPATGDLFE